MRNKILILFFTSTFADFFKAVLPKTCPDEDIKAKCESKCESGYVECTLSCTDTSCLTECARVLTDCINDCPCNLNCLNGCEGCENPICVCGENPSPQNDDNLQQCMKERSVDLGQCIIDCNGEQSCEQSCVNIFKVQYNQCPCQDGCPLGCPCDSFDCQPDKKSVLVLNTYSSNKPVLIKFDGGVDENLDFTMGPNTSAYCSCSATLNGELFVFGGTGSSQNKQISKVVDCTLKRIGELPNEFGNGACGNFIFDGNERVMFCFPVSNKKKCFSYNGENYTDHPDSVSDHDYTTLGNINNTILAVGSLRNVKVEMFDISSNTWSTKTSFPYCSSGISEYGLISRQSSTFIIGGLCDSNNSALVAEYTVDKWKRVGYLQDTRKRPRAIANDNRIYVVGGYGNYKTEIWLLDENNDITNVKIAEPSLASYTWYPELFIVDSDFCAKK